MFHHPIRRSALPALATAGLLATFAVAVPVSASTGTFTNPAPIVISSDEEGEDDHVSGYSDTDIVFGDTAGPGSESPSSIELVAPANTTVQEISVQIGLTHERIDDLDLMLVAPNGKGIMLLSDGGGDAAYTNTSLRFRAWNREFPDAGNPYSWSYYAPTDWDTTAGDTDSFPTGAPTSAPDDFEHLYGSTVAGAWSLYTMDDTDGAVGTISDWSLNVYYATEAVPSPSSLTVAGLPNSITDVDLTLNDVNVEYLSDTEFVLESPDGRRAHVMSDAGGWELVEGADITLDDEAVEPLMRGGTATAGSYRPVDYDDGDTSEFVGGFDTKNLSSALSTFDGANPNGAWKLYVSQEYCFCSNDLNAISGGWSLDITTADAAAAPVITSPVNGSRDADGAVTLTGTAEAGSAVKVTVGAKTRNTTAQDGTWTVTVADLPNGPHTFTATATNASGNASAPATVTVVVDMAPAAVVVTETETDTKAPTVRTVKPRKNEDRVKTSASALVRFSEAMNGASLTKATKLIDVSTGKAVKVKVSYQPAKNLLTINPKGLLDHDTTYLVVVKTSAKDLAGNSLKKAQKSRFTTR